MNPDDRRGPMSPQLAVRVTVVGGFALLMFGIIFFRLWFLQVLNTQAYTRQAVSNQVRNVDIPAPRGEIVDRDGNPLVESSPTLDVVISPTDLPDPATTDVLEHPTFHDRQVYTRLAKYLDMPTKPHRCKMLTAVKTFTLPDGKPSVEDIYARPFLSPIACTMAQKVTKQPAYQNVTIKQNVPRDVAFYLAERQNLLQGVEEPKVYRRTYPLGQLAAQLFGTVGPITRAQTNDSRYKGVSPNAVIGQSGLEYEYDKYLRGTDGNQPVAVNALGQFEHDETPTLPTSGNTLKLSLDTKLQEVGEQALKTSIEANPGSTGGAFVAMNPVNGQIYGMGSNPTYSPSDFTAPMTNAYYKAHYGPNSGDPLDNRAIAGGGPDGSTFKVITATAALQSGVWSTNSFYDDTGQFCFTNSTLCLHNSGHAAYGSVDMVDALKVSDDVFFYHLGALLNSTAPNGGQLQKWARAFGIGRPTGIDLPDASSGALPTPNYLQYLYKQELECEKAIGPYAGHPPHPAASGGCGISNAQSRYWTIGDNVNTAVGQGDDYVTPLQLAVAYAALANGGNIVKPHVGLQVDSPAGQVLQNFNPKPIRHLNLNPAYRQTILTGLREAASSPGGTSADVMGDFPQQVYAKTGTAEYNGQPDYAWYAAFVPPSATTTPIVVVVWVERGGFGDVAAAPVARQILSQWFYGKPGPYKSGTSTTL